MCQTLLNILYVT